MEAFTHVIDRCLGVSSPVKGISFSLQGSFCAVPWWITERFTLNSITLPSLFFSRTHYQWRNSMIQNRVPGTFYTSASSLEVVSFDMGDRQRPEFFFQLFFFFHMAMKLDNSRSRMSNLTLVVTYRDTTVFFLNPLLSVGN